jgi:hypothetical protein
VPWGKGLEKDDEPKMSSLKVRASRWKSLESLDANSWEQLTLAVYIVRPYQGIVEVERQNMFQQCHTGLDDSCIFRM